MADRARALLLLAVLGALVTPRSASPPAHGPEHPPVTLHAPAFARSSTRPGWTEVRVGVSGAVEGFTYTVRLEVMSQGGEGRHYHTGGQFALQRWETRWPSPGEARASRVTIPISPGETATVVWRDAEYRATHDRYNFRVFLFDAYSGLASEEDALVAKRDFSVALEGWAREERPQKNTRWWDVTRSGASSWKQSESAWRAWLGPAFRDLARASFFANVPAAEQHLVAPTPEETESALEACDEDIWKLPVSVMNLPENAARRESSRRLLQQLGFSNVSFPPVMAWQEIREEDMTAQDMIADSFFSRLRSIADTNKVGEKKYAANALTHIRRIRAAAAAKEPVVIMEDDLMAAAPVQLTRNHICRTLSTLPSTADMVYMEYCFESCSYLWYDKSYPRIARAFEPSCSAAVFFTAQGARKVADLCLPVFNSIDKMYPHLIRKGWLEAYVMTPSAFYQDHAFGSTMSRSATHLIEHNHARQETCHQPSTAAPCCYELYAAPSKLRDLTQVDLRQIGIVLSDAEVSRGILEVLETIDACRSTAISMMARDTFSDFIWLKYPVFNAWIDALGGKRNSASRLMYSLRERGGNGTFVPVANWTLGSECGVLLRLGRDSDCFYYNETQPCEIRTSLVHVNESMTSQAFLVRSSQGCQQNSTCSTKPFQQHGDDHPLVTIAFGTDPLVSTRAGEMTLRFHLVGAVVGFRYRIVVQEVSIRTAQVNQQVLSVLSVEDDSSASSEAATELALFGGQEDNFRFAIAVFDAHEGLTDEEALVARKDGTFTLTRRGGRTGKAGQDTEDGAEPSNSSYSETHTFVFEQAPEPHRGYGRIRCASITVPTIFGKEYAGMDSYAAQTTELLCSDAVRGLEQAGSANVDVAVLPEFFAGHAPQILVGSSQKLGGGWRGWRGGFDVVPEIARVAAKHRMYVVCPIMELVIDEDASREGKNKAYSTVVILGRDGMMVGKYRKRYLHWSEENNLPIPALPGLVRSKGSREGERVQPPPVFDLDFGRVSVLTCFDINYPELWMHLSARGVDIVFWPSMYSAGALLRSIARVFHLHIISSVRLVNAPPQLVDLVGEPIIPEVLDNGNSVDWVAYIVSVDLSKQLMHADMLHPSQVSELKKDLDTNMVNYLDEAEGWFIWSRENKRPCRLPNTVPNSTQDSVCGRGGLKEYIRRSRDDINRRRQIPNSEFKKSEHRTISKNALAVDDQAKKSRVDPTQAQQDASGHGLDDCMGFVGAQLDLCTERNFWRERALNAEGRYHLLQSESRSPDSPVATTLHVEPKPSEREPEPDHPPLLINFGDTPLVSTHASKMTLRFHLMDAVVAFRYSIVVLEINVLTGIVNQQNKFVHYVNDESFASSEITADLDIYDGLQDEFKFVIAAFDANGQLLARKDGSFPLVVTVLPNHEDQAPRRRSKILFFLHIHKSGGTTFCNLARQNRISGAAPFSTEGDCRKLYCVQNNLRCCGGEKREEQVKFALENPYVEMVASDNYMYAEMDTEHYEYVIVLRRPLDRYYSHFRHQQTDLIGAVNTTTHYNCTDEFGHVYAVNCSFATWIRGQQDNWMVRRVCGTRCIKVPKYGLTEYHLDFAKKRLANFSHILFLEEFQEGFSEIARKVGWSTTNTSKHRAGTKFASRPVGSAEEFQPEIHLDNLLYDYARQLHHTRRNIGSGEQLGDMISLPEKDPQLFYYNLSCPFEWSKYSCAHQARAWASQGYFDEIAQLLRHGSTLLPRPGLGISTIPATPRRILVMGDSLARQVVISWACLLYSSGLVASYHVDWTRWPCHHTPNCMQEGEHSGFHKASINLVNGDEIHFFPTGIPGQTTKEDLARTLGSFAKEVQGSGSISVNMASSKLTLVSNDVLILNVGIHFGRSSDDFRRRVASVAHLGVLMQEAHRAPQLVYLTTPAQHFRGGNGNGTWDAHDNPPCSPFPDSTDDDNMQEHCCANQCSCRIQENMRATIEREMLQVGLNVDAFLDYDDLDKGGSHVGYPDCSHYCQPGPPDLVAVRLATAVAELTTAKSKG